MARRGNLEVKVNRAEVGAILKGGSGMREVLEDIAQSIADEAGEGFETDYEVGPRRAHSSVRAATDAAIRDEAANRSLTNAIDAGRR
jgi:hypothetical protein